MAKRTIRTKPHDIKQGLTCYLVSSFGVNSCIEKVIMAGPVTSFKNYVVPAYEAYHITCKGEVKKFEDVDMSTRSLQDLGIIPNEYNGHMTFNTLKSACRHLAECLGKVGWTVVLPKQDDIVRSCHLKIEDDDGIIKFRQICDGKIYCEILNELPVSYPNFGDDPFDWDYPDYDWEMEEPTPNLRGCTLEGEEINPDLNPCDFERPDDWEEQEQELDAQAEIDRKLEEEEMLISMFVE